MHSFQLRYYDTLAFLTSRSLCQMTRVILQLSHICDSTFGSRGVWSIEEICLLFTSYEDTPGWQMPESQLHERQATDMKRFGNGNERGGQIHKL